MNCTYHQGKEAIGVCLLR